MTERRLTPVGVHYMVVRFAWPIMAVLLLIGIAPNLAAQQRLRRELHISPSGEVLDFAPNGGWSRYRIDARQTVGERAGIFDYIEMSYN